MLNRKEESEMKREMDLKIEKVRDILNQKGSLAELTKEEDSRIYVRGVHFGNDVVIEEYNGFYWSEVEEIANNDQTNPLDALENLFAILKHYGDYWEDYEEDEETNSEKAREAKENFLSDYLIKDLLEENEEPIRVSTVGFFQEVMDFAQSQDEERLFFY